MSPTFALEEGGSKMGAALALETEMCTSFARERLAKQALTKRRSEAKKNMMTMIS
jgi:hypothetical protein